MYKFKVSSVASNRSGVISIARTQVTKRNDKWVINLKYGYESHWGKWCTEGKDSLTPGQRYRIMNQWYPKEGDVLVNLRTNRTFVVGKIDGFVFYEAPLLENGNEVATLKFEDYYKD